MFKKLIFTLIIYTNIFAEYPISQNQMQPNVLNQILEEVKKDKFKTEGAVDVEFESLIAGIKRLSDLVIHTKEVKKSIITGQEVLNKINESLTTHEKPTTEFNKAKATIKTAQQEHKKTLKAVENTKDVMKKSIKQINDQVKLLNDSLKPLNEKSKVAVEKSFPVLQANSNRSYLIPLD